MSTPTETATPKKLADTPFLLAAGGDAIRAAQGREKWSTDNLPGKDMAAARAVLALADAAIELSGHPALATLQAENAELRAERDEWEGRWLERGDDLKLAEGERDRFAVLVEQAQRGQLPWRDEMGNDRGTAAGSAVVYEARIAALEERDALRDSVALSRSKMLHEAEGERDRLRELLERCCLFIPEKGAIWGDVNAALAATPHTEASERLGAEERKAQAAEGERDRLRELLRDTVSDLDWWYTNHGKQEPTATRASRSLVRRGRAALAAIPHTEGEAPYVCRLYQPNRFPRDICYVCGGTEAQHSRGEASAPPKETTHDDPG